MKSLPEHRSERRSPVRGLRIGLMLAGAVAVVVGVAAPAQAVQDLKGMRDQVAEIGAKIDALEAEARTATRRDLVPAAIKKYQQMALELDGQVEILQYIFEHELDPKQKARDTEALEAAVDRLLGVLELIEFLETTKK